MRHITIAAAGLTALTTLPAYATGEQITVRGEFIDTWCYFSGVMGGPDAVQGSAHHTCALWCSAGGIPVGMLAEDGTVYMILSIEGDGQNAGGARQMELASHVVTANVTLYERDGLNYVTIDEIVEDEGIVNLNHEDYGVVPGFAIPNPNN
ncbi:MAG: hypothetical protein AAGA70_00290 [Pseudomonadota bacterium]